MSLVLFLIRIICLESVFLFLSRFAWGIPSYLAALLIPLIATILKPPPISAKMGPRQVAPIWKYFVIFSYLLAAGVFPIAIYLNKWINGSLVICAISLVICFSIGMLSRFFISDPTK